MSLPAWSPPTVFPFWVVLFELLLLEFLRTLIVIAIPANNAITARIIVVRLFEMKSIF